MDKQKLVYIAGPMRSIADFNFPAFDKARDLLRAKGFTVISPADLDREAEAANKQLHGIDGDGNKLAEIIRRDVDAVQVVDCIALLPGWENSKGARAELALAQWREIPVLDALTGELYEPSILQEALRITRGDRQSDYGHPLDEHQDIADLWTAYLGLSTVYNINGCLTRAVTPQDVAMMMVCLKIARNKHKPKRDNNTDIAGYADCHWRIEQEQLRRKNAT